MGRAKKWSLCASLVQKGTTYANVCRTEMMSHSLRESLNTHRSSAARDRDGGWDILASHSTPSHAGLAKTGDDVRERGSTQEGVANTLERVLLAAQLPCAPLLGGNDLPLAWSAIDDGCADVQNWSELPFVYSAKDERYLAFKIGSRYRP